MLHAMFQNHIIISGSGYFQHHLCVMLFGKQVQGGNHTSSEYFLKSCEHEYLIHCELTAQKQKQKNKINLSLIGLQV